MQQMNITVTLCYQYKSDYYDSVKLNCCVAKAVDLVDKGIDGYNVLYDEIKEGLRSGFIHKNIDQTIQNANVVVFEISDLNPNVLYELGMARGLGKKFILMREESVESKLPFDIQPLMYIPYARERLTTFHSVLADRMTHLIKDVKVTDLIPESMLSEYLKEHIIPLQTTDVLTFHIRNMIRSCEVNFYYIGVAGLVTLDEKWVKEYEQYLGKMMFCRIVFLRSLKEMYEKYKDIKLLESYCLWLANYYNLLKKDILTLYSSPEVGASKAGACILVGDASSVLVTTGTFEDFNYKGVLIKNKTVGNMFKEYAKILALSSTRINEADIGRYFSLSTATKSVPESITQAIEASDTSMLKNACKDYVREELAKIAQT